MSNLGLINVGAFAFLGGAYFAITSERLGDIATAIGAVIALGGLLVVMFGAGEWIL